MLLALISDVHDNEVRLLQALRQAQAMGCTHLLCMGDIVALDTFRTLCEAWPHGMDIVFGNNEYERTEMMQLAEQFPHVRHHGDAGSVDRGGRRLFLTHYPSIAARAMDSGAYDAVFYGHTHAAESFRVGNTLAANPGEICGNRYPASFAVYDTETHEVQTFML